MPARGASTRGARRAGLVAVLAIALGPAPVAAAAAEANGQGEAGRGAGAAPGRVVVEQGDAERALERALIQAGGLLLPPGDVELEPSLQYARSEDDFPAFVSRDGETFLARRRRDADELVGSLALRVGLPLDSQLELSLPYHWRRVQETLEVGGAPTDAETTSATGIGNLRIGVAKTLAREQGWRPDLIARLRWDTRTGRDRDDGLVIADDFDALQLSVTAIRRQDPVVFLGSLAIEHVLERDGIQPGMAVTPTIGSFVALSPQTSMRFLFTQTFRGETDTDTGEIPGSERNAASFVVGGSSTLGRGVLLNLSVTVGLTGDASDAGWRVALPIRF